METIRTKDTLSQESKELLGELEKIAKLALAFRERFDALESSDLEFALLGLENRARKTGDVPALRLIKTMRLVVQMPVED
jgi:hypothetical protein